MDDMASIYRPTSIRYLDADGKQVPKSTPGATRKRVRSKTWRARFTDANGNDKTESLGTQDRQEAQERLAELLQRVKQRQADPYAEHREKPLSEHLADYTRHLEAKNSSQKHVAKVASYVGRVLEDCGFVTLADFDPNKLADYLHERRQPVPVSQVSLAQAAEIVEDAGDKMPKRAELNRHNLPTPDREARQGSPAVWQWSTLRKWLEAEFGFSLPRQCPLPDQPGLSIFGSNDYLAAIKAFANWLVRSRRLAENPFRFLSKLNAATEVNRKHERRPASHDDFQKLLQATIDAPPFRGLTGRDRVMLYLLAVSTGFRASELASLTNASFDFDADVPTVTVLAGYSKRRRTDARPLRNDLAASLRQFIDDRMSERQGGKASRIWSGNWPEKASVMLRRDLEAAGVAYQDEAGRYLDFHSLRHTFGTNLAKAGVAPKVAQELMRHSDVNLTLGIYSHVGMQDLAGAVEKLPAMPFDREFNGTGSGFSCTKVALKTGKLGNYQDFSAVTGDQIPVSASPQNEQRKSHPNKQVTAIGSAHKKEPPLGLEPRTYALRKRRSAD